MDVLSRSEIRSLMEVASNGSLCVSIYTSTHPTGSLNKEDMIRYKNLLADAERQMTACGVPEGRAKHALEPAARLLEDGKFWREAGGGVAVFLSEKTLRSYRVAMEFDPVAVVGHQWYLKPLLPLFSGDGRFFVLSLSLNEIRLFHCSRDNCQQVNLKLRKLPTSFAEAMKYTVSEKTTQFHTNSPPRPTTGARAPVYYGMGSRTDEAQKKRDITDFLHQLNRGLSTVTNGTRDPMILAGVDSLCSMFREISDYPNIVGPTINGNPEMWGEKELHEKAWPIVEPLFKQAQQTAADRYQLARSRHAGSSVPEEVIAAAAAGRVDTLFVDLDRHQWGRFDAGTVDLHEQQQNEDEDLSNLAGVQTLLHDGTVFAVPQQEMPGGHPVAAVFRY